MRIAAFVGTIIVATLVNVGGIALLLLASPPHIESLIWLPIVSLMVFVYGPLLIGSVTAYWDVRASPDAWRYFRWWFVVVYGLQVLGAAAIVVFAVLAAAPAWLPLAYIVVAVLLNLLALRVGRALRRREESRRPADATWRPITRESIVRRILIVAATFMVVLIVGGVGFSVLFSFVAVHHRGIGTALAFAVEFAFLGAAFACIAVSLRLNRMVREQVSRDVGRLRKVAKVVLRGKRIPLDPDEELAAARYAVVIGVTLPFTLAYITLIYVGMAIQEIGQLGSEPGDPFPKVFLGFLIVALVVLLPLSVIRIRRAHTYARSHAALLDEDGGQELA